MGHSLSTKTFSFQHPHYSMKGGWEIFPYIRSQQNTCKTPVPSEPGGKGQQSGRPPKQDTASCALGSSQNPFLTSPPCYFPQGAGMNASMLFSALRMTRRLWGCSAGCFWRKARRGKWFGHTTDRVECWRTWLLTRDGSETVYSGILCVSLLAQDSLGFHLSFSRQLTDMSTTLKSIPLRH